MPELKTVEVTREYYDSDSADTFYSEVWGGEDIHIGLYQSENDSIADASQRTVYKMASLLELNQDIVVLDIGSGYGGSARYLAKTFGCKINCLNLSEVQNQRNRRLNEEQGWDKLIKVINGNFEEIPDQANSYDVVWSQDAILHSSNRLKVLAEVRRVLKSGGDFIFTDIMQSEDCPEGVLQPVYDRIHLDSLGAMNFYRQNLTQSGFQEIQFLDLSQQLINHYSAILSCLEANYDEFHETWGEYVEQQKVGLKHWIEAGTKGYLNWGIFHFRSK